MTGLEVTLLSILAVFYIVMFAMLGVATLRKGRPVLFVLGFFFPLVWIFGALLPPNPTAADVAAARAENDRLYAN